jgi:hypothetical protein
MKQDLIGTDELEALTMAERSTENFNVVDWLNLYTTAYLDKITSMWNEQARVGSLIKSNQYPTKPPEAAPNWKGRLYKDNWIWKAIEWKIAMLTGAETHVDLKTIEGTLSPMLEPLQYEVDYMNDKFDITQNDEEVIRDKEYKGEGWQRLHWNTKRNDAFYRTGTPEFDYIDTEKISIDPATTKRDKSDMRYLFHEEWYDTKTLKMRFPKYARQIMESRQDQNPNALAMTKLIVVQYKKPITSWKIDVVHTATGTMHEFKLIELQNIIRQQTSNPEAIKEYGTQIEAGETTMEFPQWLLNMWIFPEGVEVSDPRECEEDTVWQAMIYPDAELVLQQPTYVWHDYTYINLPGYKQDKKSLCYGSCYYSADKLEMSSVLMTTLMIVAAKMNIPKEKIVQGALSNEEDYKKDGHKIGVNPIEKADWQKNNPNVKSVEQMPLPDFPQVLLTLNDMLNNAIKTDTGVIDSVQGQMQYSGQPGIAIAQLQQASRVYFKNIIQDYAKYNQKRVEWIADMITRYRNYPHKILGLDENNNEAMVDIATNPFNQLQSKYCTVHVSIVENYEVIKAMEKESNMAFYQMGLIPGELVLKDAGKSNPKKLISQAQAEQGVKAREEAIAKSPNLAALVEQVVKSGKDIEIPEQQTA